MFLKQKRRENNWKNKNKLLNLLETWLYRLMHLHLYNLENVQY